MVDATEIFHDLCWLLECEMATLEDIKERKRTSKSDLQRHTNIVNSMLDKVWSHYLTYGFEIPPRQGRVRDAVKAMHKELL